MALIKQVKQVKKTTISIQVSRDLAEKFNSELEMYNKNNQANASLDFDPLAKKLIDELAKINNPIENISDKNSLR